MGLSLRIRQHRVCISPFAHQSDIARGRRRLQDTATRTARDFGAMQGIYDALHGSHSRHGSPQSRLRPAVPHRGRWRSRQRQQSRARSFQWCRLWSSYRCRRGPDPSVRSTVQDQCGRAHICRTTARDTAAKRSGHIEGTQSRRTGRDSALHILVQPVNDSLRLARGFDIESAQGYFTPSDFLHTIMLFLIYCIALLV